jgi:DNA-binding IclR family transcriptional regulator
VKSLERMMAILDYFESETIEWTTEALHAELGYTRSTLYRYLKVLTDAGLLTSLPEVGYTLGPRIAELDYQMRERDPLISASRPVMASLVEEIPGIALLCRRYRDRVLCVHQEQNTQSFRSNYERGLARPLLRGAASRIILAFMPAPVIRKLYEADSQSFADAGLGASLAEVRAALRTIRQAGWDISTGHVTPGVTGIAAPIFDRRDNVLGSLSLTLGVTGLSSERTRAIAERVMFCAGIVSRTVSHRERLSNAAAT